MLILRVVFIRNVDKSFAITFIPIFTFIFFVQDKETGEVEYETTIYSQVYELSFQKGADGVTRVQGITREEEPETHLFDISIKDGYVNLTENGVPIGEIN